MNYGEKIVALRREQGLTQAELGAKLNVTFQAVSKWERGESQPDFETMSRIAKLFGVSLAYFEDGGERERVVAQDSPIASSSAQIENQERKIVCYCGECGKTIYEGDKTSKNGTYTICDECADIFRRAAIVRKQKEENRVSEEKRECRYIRNKGLIISAIIWGILMILGFAFIVRNFQSALGLVIITLFGYVFVAQLFWDGAVVEVCLAGGKIVGMPGVIFSFDLDGFIFLIGMKLLFAVIRFLIFILTLFVTVAVAFVISPFTFVPQLLKLNRGEEL